MNELLCFFNYSLSCSTAKIIINSWILPKNTFKFDRVQWAVSSSRWRLSSQKLSFSNLFYFTLFFRITDCRALTEFQGHFICWYVLVHCYCCILLDSKDCALFITQIYIYLFIFAVKKKKKKSSPHPFISGTHFTTSMFCYCSTPDPTTPTDFLPASCESPGKWK